jgi:hypothetical protein
VGRLLQEIPRDELSAWLLETAKVVPDFGKRLNLYIARHSPAEAALVQYRATVETLVKSRNRNPQKRAREAAQNFDGLQAALTAEFAAGRTELVMAVCTEGIRAIHGFLSENSDPKGKLQELTAELARLHLAAATELRPKQWELAMELVQLGQEFSFTGALREAAYEYRDILGDAGLGWFREAMEPYWQDTLNAVRMPWHRREQTRGQMLAWARSLEDPASRAVESGRVLAAVAASAGEFLQAAKSLLRGKHEDEAMIAAEKGFALAKRSPYVEDTLFDLAILRMERAEPEAAVEIAWQVFRARPDQDSYSLLRQAAAAIGAEMEYWARAVDRLKEIGSRWTPPTPAAT